MMVFLALIGVAGAITRETVLDAAAHYATHTWTMSASNETASCSSEYESDYAPGEYNGLPYDWGGYVTLDEFDAQIADDYGAGSHSWHGVLSCTTGVDCSGYVSELWGSGHYATSTFSAVADDIAVSALAGGDAVNDSGSHMVLYTYETGAGTPVFYEASGSASKVRLNSSSGWSYLDGYQPIRYERIEDGSFDGTASDPIEISSFPFTDYRWTAGAPSDQLDSYDCAPDTLESGPEVLYHLSLSSGGVLSAVVSADSGVDIDIHVLTAISEDACLDRDDSAVSVTVPAGDIWLSLDTYVGSREYPGPFLLTVDFEPDGSGDGSGGDSGGGASGGGDDGGGDDSADIDSGVDSGLDSGGGGKPGGLVPLSSFSEGKGLCATSPRGAGPKAGLFLAFAALVGLSRRRR